MFGLPTRFGSAAAQMKAGEIQPAPLGRACHKRKVIQLHALLPAENETVAQACASGRARCGVVYKTRLST